MPRRSLRLVSALAMLAGLLAAGPALAKEQAGDSERVQIKPILDARLRYETVDQGALDADAVTLRVRAGAEAKLGKLSLLAEGEGTLVPVDHYNALPFATGNGQRRTQYAVVADPENLELNRLQLQYKSHHATVTAGRQRINLDDQRWVGSVGWRQNEQTFDAIRGEVSFRGVSADVTYAISQRTIFGEDAGARTGVNGDFVFAGIGTKLGPFQGKIFSYLVDYHEAFAFPNSSQTYGAFVSGELPVGKTTLSARASYARQLDYRHNPFDYSADYWLLEGGAKWADFTALAGWEKLGSDNGFSVQTPLATLHKFNGWADLFLTTPPAGLEDTYVSVSKTFEGVRRLRGINAGIAFHQFDSAVGGVEYGKEWDASAGFKVGNVAMLLKYANYNARNFGSDTEKLWLQLEWAL